MGRSRGSLTQKFKIKVDIDKLLAHITDSILDQINTDNDIDYVDFDEYYVEDTDLIIDGSYGADYESSYFPATRYEPAEYDCERPWIGDEGVGLLDTLPEDIRKYIDITKVTEDEDHCDYKDNEPDYDDRAYDEWKDRQLEGE